MLLRSIRWARRRPVRAGGALLGVLVVLANALAFAHAWRFTHFVEGGTKTADPEDLTFLEKARCLVAGVTVPRPALRGAPAAPHATVRFPTTDGLELEAWHVPVEDPAGTVVLFHGYTGVRSDVLAQAAAFRELGHDTLLVDFRGSGGSDGNETTIGWREADDVAAAARFAREELGAERVFLYGQSMGAAAILRAAAVNGLDVDGLVVACPFDRLTTTVAHRFHLMGAPASPGTQLLLFWGSVQQGYWCFDHAPVEYAAHVTLPVLHLQWTADQRVSLDEARSIHDALAGPKRLVTFEGVDHDASCLAADRARWMGAVGEFLGAGG